MLRVCHSDQELAWRIKIGRKMKGSMDTVTYYSRDANKKQQIENAKVFVYIV